MAHSVSSNLIEVEGHAATLVSSGAEALALLASHSFDAVLLDLMLGQSWGLDVLREARAARPDVPVIVITAHGSVESAAEAVRSDAFDYIGKPFASADLLATLARAFEWRDRRGSAEPQQAAHTPPAQTAIVGKSAAMVGIYRLIARVAATDSTVLIVGESGTGKELIARAIHDNSARSRRHFVAVNCGALTETLLESELFGHVRGAWTCASSRRRIAGCRTCSARTSFATTCYICSASSASNCRRCASGAKIFLSSPTIFCTAQTRG